MTSSTRPIGKLGISLKSESVFLGDNLSVEVRDEKRQLVKTLRGAAELELGEGLYSVSAILDDGERETRFAQVSADREVRVDFAMPQPHPFSMPTSGMRASESLGGGWDIVEISGELDTSWVSKNSLRLRLKLQGTAPAWIGFRRGDTSSACALPLSTTGVNNDICWLTIHEFRERAGDSFHRLRPTVSLAPRRSVARALYLMMDSGRVGSAIELARDAAELLAAKYQDPVGAAYGGLLLHRFGILQDRASWVENLARDFAWLPDGRILLAALLERSVSHEERDRGLSALLDATVNLPTVFSEAFSLALSLLRRWRDKESTGRRHERLSSLRRLAGHFDFAASCSLVHWPSKMFDKWWG
jgi:hypothetical protein